MLALRGNYLLMLMFIARDVSMRSYLYVFYVLFLLEGPLQAQRAIYLSLLGCTILLLLGLTFLPLESLKG